MTAAHIKKYYYKGTFTKACATGDVQECNCFFHSYENRKVRPFLFPFSTGRTQTLLPAQSTWKFTILFAIILEKTKISRVLFWGSVVVKGHALTCEYANWILFIHCRTIHNWSWFSFQKFPVVRKPSEKEPLPVAVCLEFKSCKINLFLFTSSTTSVQPPLRLMLDPDTSETRRNPSITPEVSSQVVKQVLYGLWRVKCYQTTFISALEEASIKIWVKLANPGY